ncbi:hypothetical protein [Sphingobacterium sp. CZ-2]|uniref:hypothetical protein n=1 Tax=Sphingobacterium sp. CZ-2 TaxID=2557994 RepID=UPI00106FED5F|nr:hypothetical protein [Sphingobacterium sp. CZ-2]QBR10670.1 hypothetical protein E3D81_00130 [Sphingobacterium sp. CZ-2]
MNSSYENRAIRILLQPSIHLYNILNYYSDENKNKILYCLANEQITELVSFLNELIENNNEYLEGAHGEAMNIAPDQQLELLSLQLHIRLFISELRESYATVRDLLYHKDDSNVINILNIVNDVLNKELKNNNIVIPDHVLTGIRDKVQEGVKQALTPPKDMASQDSKKIVKAKMEDKNNKKLFNKN